MASRSIPRDQNSPTGGSTCGLPKKRAKRLTPILKQLRPESSSDSDDSLTPTSKEEDSCSEEMDVVWSGNMYQYTDVKLSLLTVNLRHIRCRCTTSLGTVNDIDAFIKENDSAIVVPTCLRMLKYCKIEVCLVILLPCTS